MKAPTIIIGVGGVGSQICAKVEEQLLHTVSQSGNRGPTDNTRFVAIDTDVNSLRELQRHGFQGKRILLTDNMTVSKCRDTINDPSIDRWYPENTFFSKKSMTEGAGQQRSISRLAFEYCMRDGRLDQLDDTVRELNQLTKEDSHQRTRFYIISSLAGGTGSGIILPLAMYINNSILEMYGDNLAICKGFFILSSAFYARTRMPALERKSLDANAYAAVKELSAFMRAADGGGVQAELSYLMGGKEPRSKASYEYCYLFGLTNERNKDICSFEELKGVVADAVYMQACSPMQERNDSREDNTLRHVGMLGESNQENWLRRFGGIGCGRLVYPYEELVRYFGLCWAKDTMGKTWRQYDEEYFRKRKRLKDQESIVPNTAELDQGEEYIKAVDDAGPSDRLAAYIRTECVEQGGDKARWELYLEALNAEAGREVAALWKQYKQSNIWGGFQTKLQDLTNQIGASADRHHAAAQAGTLWDQIWEEVTERLNPICDSVCSSLFRLHAWDPAQGRSALRDCWLEYWMVSATGEFLHPNSLRYFMYQLRRAVIQGKKDPISMTKPNPPFQKKKNGKLGIRDGDLLKQKFDEQKAQLNALMTSMLCERILNRCEDYVKRIINCYEDFYNSYDMILDEFDTDIRTIGKKLDQKVGVIHYYVCADGVCRDKLYDELRLRRGYDVGAVSGVSYELFRLIHANGLEAGRMATRECANKIKDFWSAGIERKNLGGELLDMNILWAMSMEAKFKTGRTLGETDFAEEICRVEDSLVAPFLQFFRRLDMNTGISLCCYHSSLKAEIGTFQNMVRWLDSHNAIDDPDYCTKRELLFYRSFVGLEPYEVLDYLHGISAQTAVKGRAFRSYVEMLRDMGKNGENVGKTMTPHADIKWHNLYYAWDPSVSYQREQELLIAVALLSACLKGKVRLSKGEKNYSYTPPTVNSDTHDVTFDFLMDLHILLYGNIYWYMEECWKMYRSVLEALNKREDPYQKISEIENRSPFDLMILYQNELPYGRRTPKQRLLLADAGVCLIYACTEKPFDRSREKACRDSAIKQLENTQKALESGKVIGLKEAAAAAGGSDPAKTVTIGEDFKAEMKNFVSSFVGELKEMNDDEFRRRYGTIMGDFFAEAQRET